MKLTLTSLLQLEWGHWWLFWLAMSLECWPTSQMSFPICSGMQQNFRCKSPGKLFSSYLCPLVEPEISGEYCQLVSAMHAEGDCLTFWVILKTLWVKTALSLCILVFDFAGTGGIVSLKVLFLNFPCYLIHMCSSWLCTYISAGKSL
jgi:hypothetical protein